ncbi:hypothetical protein A3D79_02045 [Candidatus Daviesbacteria bacterium RIFCSPHIGHO2_02_FULL_39_8]|nr:MAG: hypothetical protein A3D79_02045 [Candidatus Daviesbacteria bacterium RIFCSPHIGHO2_02_FULL_39_8]
MPNYSKVFGLLVIIFLILSLIYNLNLIPRMPKIPGDIYFNKPGFSIYIPWVSAIVLSIIITLTVNFFR